MKLVLFQLRDIQGELKKGQDTAQKAQTELQHSRKKCEDVTAELTRQTSQVMTDAIAALKPMDHVTVVEVRSCVDVSW